MPRYVCIHGHFYQPPRENPWLEYVEREPSATPAHDWNTRILNECYHPNTHARIRDHVGRVRGIMNTYSRISFNFGPTLVHWMERHFPETLAAIVEADQESTRRFDGHGNAIAQAYNHTILPLAELRDKRTQIRWGLQDFERIFGRRAEGMWLPETAVDRETLEVLAEHDIRFTILSPRQAHRCRPLEGGAWAEVNEHTLETRRPYLCRISEGKSIALFFYHGGLAGDVAFGGILREPSRLVERIRGILPQQLQEPAIGHLATDGESYGHHSRGGEESLAYVLDTFERDQEIQLTNYGCFLSKYPPRWEIEIREKTSWSCAYGIERWRSGAGYTRPEWNFDWRKGLRDGLDALKFRLDEIFEKEGSRYFVDAWAARDASICYLSERSFQSIEMFLERFLSPEGKKGERSATDALRLLEMQHQAQLMYTSCGWFFDDISNLEAQIILRHAWNAIRMTEGFADAETLERTLLAHLSQTQSNHASWGDGARVWFDAVRPSQITDERIFMSALMRALFLEKQPIEGRSFDAYVWHLICRENRKTEKRDLCVFLGFVQATSRFTLEERRFAYCILHLGGLDLHAWMVELLDDTTYPRLRDALEGDIRLMPTGRLYERLRERFGGSPLGLHALISEDVEAVTSALLGNWLHRYEEILSERAKLDIEMLHHLHDFDGPLPSAVRLALGLLQYEDFFTALQIPEAHLAISQRQQIWKRLWLDDTQRNNLTDLLQKEILRRMESTRDACGLLEPLQGLFGMAAWLSLPLSMPSLQDAFLVRCCRRDGWKEQAIEWIQGLGELFGLSPTWITQLIRGESATQERDL